MVQDITERKRVVERDRTTQRRLQAQIRLSALGEATYREFLLSFGREHGADATLIRERLEAGDLDGARLTAHTLKGVAGNLAATRLHAGAAALEEALKAGRADEALRCQPELAARLAEVLSAVALLERVSPAAEQAALPVAPAEMKKLLTELSGLLQARDLGALEIFAQVRPYLTTVEPARVAHLTHSLDKLDFRQALTELEALIAGIPERRNH